MTLTPPAAPPVAAPAQPADRDWAPLLAGEALVCGLLGRLLYEEPQAAWLTSLAADGVFDDIPFGASQPAVAAGLELLQAWSQQHRAGLSTDAFAELRADYTRLFLGPGKLLAPPWESAQLTVERQLFQGHTLQVRQWYRRFGLEAARLYTEPDDHLGLELAFLAHLAQRGLEALAQSDRPRLGETLTAQRDFVKAHPLRFVAQWGDQVEQHARTDFYRGVGQVIRGVLTEFASIFNLPLPKEAAR